MFMVGKCPPKSGVNTPKGSVKITAHNPSVQLLVQLRSGQCLQQGGPQYFGWGVNSPLPPLCADDHGLQACKQLVDNSGDSHCQRCSQAAQTLEHWLAVCMHDSKFSAHINALDIAGQIGHTVKMYSWFVGRHQQQHLGSFLIELGLLVHSVCTYLCHSTLFPEIRWSQTSSLN